MTQSIFSKQFLSTLCLIGAALIWGTAFVAQTTGMEYVGPLTFTNIRFIIGGLLVLPFALKEISKLRKIREKKKLLLIILATGLCLLLGSYLQQYALQYTKIGRMVYITGTLDMNSLGTLSGDYLKITGLPFTPDASNSNNYQPISTHHINVAGDTTGAHFGWTVYAANTFMYVYEHTHGGAAQATTSGDYENSTIVGCAGAYITAA